MHIALCDDNIADRKQTERLLGRESDARLHTTGVLYIDSFGHSSALLKAPMLYDLFFLDLTKDGADGLELAHQLRRAGVTAPIALCSSVTDYSARAGQPEGISHLQKPLKPEAVCRCIDQAIALQLGRERTFEIRCEQETHYIHPEKVITVVPDGHLARIRLEDGRELKMPGTLEDFYHLTEATGKFLFARKQLLVNRDYIDSYTMRRLLLKNGQQFTLNPSDWMFLRKRLPGSNRT